MNDASTPHATRRPHSTGNPEQKIITVDNDQWNPWGLTPQRHGEFTAHALRFLTATGQVEPVEMDQDDCYRSYGGPAPALVVLDELRGTLFVLADQA